MYETEFEDDDTSDFEEYAGRTSEDSVGRIVSFALGTRLTLPYSSATEVIQPPLHSKNSKHQRPTTSTASTFNCQHKKRQDQPRLLKDP